MTNVTTRNPISALRHKVAAVFRDVHATRGELAELRDEVRAHGALLRGLAPAHQLEPVVAESTDDGVVLAELKRAIDALQVIYDQEPDNRRRLHALRQTDEYELAYSESEPLVSVLIPTYRSHQTLRDRAIPSVLAQSYENWEIVVIGDAAPPETADVIASFGDPRIRYDNKPTRGPYPEDEYDAWLVTAVPPFNAALRAARGRWLAPFADDDSLRPDALEHLVAEAQVHRHEHCYAKLLLHARDGGKEEIGTFPPRLAPDGIALGMQGSILHSGLRFFEQELADAIFRTPNDWSMIRRMLRAGVRFGFLDEITCDYFPSYRGEDAPNGKPLR
jgi:hypothetical protein